MHMQRASGCGDGGRQMLGRPFLFCLLHRRAILSFLSAHRNIPGKRSGRRESSWPDDFRSRQQVERT